MTRILSNERILNVPNILTLARILLTPFIVYAILEQQPRLALLLMAAAGLTDMLDGAIARLFNQRSTVGAYMDPLADKLMLISSIVTLYSMNMIPLFLFLAVIFRDLIIVIGAIAYEIVTHKLEMRPTVTSKITTFLQILLVLAVLSDAAWHIWPASWLQDLAWLTFTLTVLSGIQYMVVWMGKALHDERT
ncbi:MAG: CDP-alcohol phosphatidyltransferase family protein [Zetaproteobacteria bacterium]|nr:MAG: CDP-alcohol phosphatidyltransferase family protein [Zetaproteobacteria bacterium]